MVSDRILLTLSSFKASGYMASSADVLVVDDRLIEAQTALVAFERVAPRASVLHLVDGGEALEYLFSTGLFAARASKMPQLVFLSLEMETVSGLCVLDLMRAHPLTCTIPVVGVSLEGNARTYRRYNQLAADAYVSLPCDFSRYCAVIEGCVERWLPWALRSHEPLSLPYSARARREHGMVPMGGTRA
jgi:two-component system, response regulator